ncbi:MAG: VOC family protein [Sphingomonadaceae bacterium]|nr:VOC family protein [Sphingomonadaceae bacterium]
MFVPAGFATVAPYLVVRDASAYIDFIVAGLGGTHVGSSRRPDGTVANGQVRFGEGAQAATVMVGEAWPDYTPGPTHLYLYVADADAAVARAEAARAEVVMRAADRPYGDRQGGVRDRWGTTWWLSQRLTPEPYAFD